MKNAWFPLVSVLLVVPSVATGATAPQGFDALASVVKTSKVPKDRLKAVQELGKLQDPRAIPVLIDAFHAMNPASPEDDWFVRRAASRALAQKGAAAVEPVKAVLADKDPIARTKAIATLGMMKAPGIQEILEKYVKADPEPQVRMECVFQMRDLGDKRSIPILKAVVKDDKDADVRDRATKALAKLEGS